MKTVFLVDDDADDRELFKSALEALDFETNFIEATDGQNALTLMLKHDFPMPDIIFVDLNMPKINGLELLIAIKKQPRYQVTPLYIYTTSRNEKEKSECLAQGAVGFITKHNSFMDLCKDLNGLFRQHLVV